MALDARSYVIKEELGVLLSNRRDGMTSEPTLLQVGGH